MRVLLAGVGFLGAHVAARLTREGHEVWAFDVNPGASQSALARLGTDVPVRHLDVTDYVAVASAVRQARPDRIINTSVLGSRASDQPALMTRVNVMGLVHLLEAARLFDVGRVVHTSSTTVYGNVRRTGSAQQRLAETELVTLSRDFYGVTKQAAEAIGHNYARHCGVDFVALRFCHIFGGGTNSPGRAIENLVEAAVEKRPAVIDQGFLFWRGREDFNYVKDAARALILACKAPVIEQRMMNISLGVHCSFDEVADMVRRQVDQSLDLRWEIERDKPGLSASLDAPYDTRLARQQIGYSPEFTLETAITDYANALRGASSR
jgi:UDP-glucose 4-epimerase